MLNANIILKGSKKSFINYYDDLLKPIEIIDENMELNDISAEEIMAFAEICKAYIIVNLTTAIYKKHKEINKAT